MENNRCEVILANGKRCKMYRIKETNRCFTHSTDPDIITEREKALKKAADTHRLYLPVECM